jgi:malate dehydrogenase
MVNIAVIGAAGGIGQPLSLLLALGMPEGGTLSLYDVAGAAGVAADISHIDRQITVRWAQGKLPTVPMDPELRNIAKGVDIFVVVAGVPRKPGMTRDDLFAVNAGIVLDVVKTCATESPKACFCIVTNPVNATVPIAAQTLKKLGVYDKNKLFGVSTLDVLRATRFINNERAPLHVPTVPVVGGHSDITIVPLFSQVQRGPQELPAEKLSQLVKRVQNAGTEVVEAKAGKGSATLSMAEAGARFALWVAEGLTGALNPVVYSFVDADGTQDSPFFAIPVVLGRSGIAQRLPIGPMSAAESDMLKVAAVSVKKSIAQGEGFARSKL